MLLSLALGACSGSKESRRYSSADAAVEAGQIALQADEFERASDAFAQARVLAPSAFHAVQCGLDQCLALIGCKAEGEALALLIDLARACAQSGKLCSPRLAELCLQIEHEEFDKQELARIDPHSIARSILQLGSVRRSGLEKLGYVDSDSNPPVSKPESLPTMQE